MNKAGLLSKTNVIGYFNLAPEHTQYAIHVDSSSKASPQMRRHAKSAISTGWAMHALNVSSEYSKRYTSLGGSVRWGNPEGSHEFEAQGIVDTLEVIVHQLSKTSGKKSLTIYTDNSHVVKDFTTMLGGSTVKVHPLLRKHLDSLANFKRTTNLKFRWEKGHSTANNYNTIADRIAFNLRAEAEAYGNLRPLQMQGVLSRVGANNKITAVKEFQKKSLNLTSATTLSALENAVVLVANKQGKANRQMDWGYAVNGHFHRKESLQMNDGGMLETVKTLANAVLEYIISDEYDSQKTVYLCGSAFKGIEHTLFLYLSGKMEAGKHCPVEDFESINYNLQTIFSGVKVVLLGDRNLPVTNSTVFTF